MGYPFRTIVSGKGILIDVSDESRKYYEWQEKYMATERDTQFAGFARALVDELMKVQSSDNTLQSEKIIAQRTYDLAHHVLRCNGIDVGFWNRRASDLYENEIIADLAGIPDMTTLPEVSQ